MAEPTRPGLAPVDDTLDLLLRVGLAARRPGTAARFLAGRGEPLHARGPVVLVAGDAAAGAEALPGRDEVVDAFTGRQAMVVSGGTTAGVAGLVGELSAMHRDVYTVGYLPRHQVASADRGYDEIRLTEAADFSALEPIRAWADLLLGGVDAADVHLLGVGGGPIAAVEYRMALALGARVGVMAASGRAVADLMVDARWGRHPGLVTLASEPGSAARFLWS